MPIRSQVLQTRSHEKTQRLFKKMKTPKSIPCQPLRRSAAEQQSSAAAEQQNNARKINSQPEIRNLNPGSLKPWNPGTLESGVGFEQQPKHQTPFPNRLLCKLLVLSSKDTQMEKEGTGKALAVFRPIFSTPTCCLSFASTAPSGFGISSGPRISSPVAFAGYSHRRTLDQTASSRHCRELSERGLATLEPGTLELWNPKTFKPWNLGILEPWNPIEGTLKLWNSGALECWNPQTLEPWTSGTLSPATLGSRQTLEPGPLSPRTPEILEPWNCGILEPWNLGTLETWNSGISNPSTQEPGTQQLWNLEPWNLATLGTVELWKPEASGCEPLSPRTLELSNLWGPGIQTLQPRNLQPCNPGTVELWKPENSQLQ